MWIWKDAQNRVSQKTKLENSMHSISSLVENSKKKKGRGKFAHMPVYE